MKKANDDRLRLGITSTAKPKRVGGGRILHPVNVCRQGTAATLTTRYGAMDTTNILTLAHYPMTAILIEYE